VLGVLQANGASHALVVYGHDGLDELTTADTSTVYELLDGAVRTYAVDPAALGLPRGARADLLGGDAATNAACVRAVLDGSTGAQRDIAVLNAAAALVAAGIAADLAGGVAAAQRSIDSGAAAGVLDTLVRTSKDAAQPPA
jgi:anthranilate phosphoribosyltransferase